LPLGEADRRAWRGSRPARQAGLLSGLFRCGTYCLMICSAAPPQR